ncbi:branched-chain amino acid ABC transporter ATP-binding protein/permease [Thalassobius sp. S69A]|uniref:branched-chain amino acid ABC transporter ATP-binding protein/permease n=1 Tax=unclassified Thalassovita TaxID=2619711 RepID=UPI000C10CD07|nr:branched-chain amino acid ABC transporter ATP-binding protein [Paracoccaceae bacterium]MBT26917.1 branched-chain amino acid ABC transporter ATP-binding protein [Paracoccaceae bacterium]
MKRASTLSALKIVGSVSAVGALCLFMLPNYWIFLLTAVFIIGMSLQSLGLVVGRSGMISLCQMSFAGVGAWTVGYLNLIGFPGGLLVWIVIGGLAALPFGLIIGLPALRLRGINLAIVTLGFAVAFGVVLGTITYPGQTTFKMVARPDQFSSDRGYFILVLAIYVLVAVALEFVSRSRLGASWLAISHSERAAASLGVSVPRAKLSAFAISSFIAGVSGGLLAGYMGTLLSENFSMMQSLVLFAVAIMVGAQYPLGAILGGILVALFPELLRRLSLPQDLGSVVFGIGAVQALSTGETMSEALGRLGRKIMPKRLSKPARSAASTLPEARPEGDHEIALDVRDLTVRYGNVVALSSASLTVPKGQVIGLIGPNGAGKSTFVDAITGFLHSYEGDVIFQGKNVNAFSATQRARAGIRRTWQTTRMAPDLTVGQYVHLASGGGLSDAQINAVLDWLECPCADQPISAVDSGARRLLDVAGVVAARPPIVLLDEPAAGQSYAEAVMLGKRIAEIPARFGSSVLLIEHDMDLVRTACSGVTVLDFGTVLAAGPTQEVLDMPIVKKAYMGIEFEQEAAE